MEDGILIINLPINTGVFHQMGKILCTLKRRQALTRLWQLETESPHMHYFSKNSIIKFLHKFDFDFVNEFSLETVNADFKDIYDRVSQIGKSGKPKAFLTSCLIWLGSPLLKVLPKDIKTFVFRKV